MHSQTPATRRLVNLTRTIKSNTVAAGAVTKVGLIGYGLIGETVRNLIDGDPENGMQVVFIHDADSKRLEGLGSLALEDLADFDSRGADLVVEMAHPSVTVKWATTILAKTNYMFISVTALADQAIEEAILATAMKHGTRAYVPHGGVVGMDALLENRDVFTEVNIVMKKPPGNIDCINVGIDPDTITEATVLYDGPTRGICPKFPRNVNTHASIAYAGIGFDRTHSLMVADPSLTGEKPALERRRRPAIAAQNGTVTFAYA